MKLVMGLVLKLLFISVVWQIGLEFQVIAMPLERGKVPLPGKVYIVDMFALPDPKQPSLQEIIFNDQLSREFSLKYAEKFGDIDSESLTYRNSRFAEFNDRVPDQNSFESSRTERKKFGEYMITRLFEWHVDKSLKERPETEKIYDAKQALSNMKMSVGKNTQLQLKYSFVDNTMELNYANPLVESKIKMDPATMENKLIISKAINGNTTLSTVFYEKDGIAAFEISRQLQKQTHAALGSSTWFQATGTSRRETISSVSFVHLF
jgi:hypothetical protein